MRNIDKIFKRAESLHSETPPPGLWDKVENELNKNEVLKYKRRYRIVLVLAIASSFLCLIFGVEKYLNVSTSIKETRIADTKKLNKTSADPTINSSNNKLLPNPGLKNNSVAEDANNSSISMITDKLHEALSTDEAFDMQNNNALIKQNQVTTIYTSNSIEKIYNLHEVLNNNLNADANHFTFKTEQNTANINSNNSNKKRNPNDHQFTLKRFSISPYISKNFVYNNLGEAFEFGNENADEISENEENNNSFSIGMFADYLLSKKWSVESGLFFTNITNTVKPSYAKAISYQNKPSFSLPTTYGLCVIDNPYITNPMQGDSFLVAGNSKQRISFLSIPIQVKYKLNKANKLRMYATGGTALNISSATALNLNVPDNQNNPKQLTSKIHGVKQIFFTGNIGVEGNYYLSRKFALAGRIQFSNSISTINKNTPITNSIFSAYFMGGFKIDL